MKKPTHFFNVGGGRLSIFFMLCFFLPIVYSYAQKEYPPGALSNGMAGAVCALTDPDHHLQAPACGAFTKQIYLSSNYRNQYLMSELYTSSVAVLVPWKRMRLGGHAQRFGPDHYKELRIGISAAHQIGHTALALRFNWEELAIEGFRTQHAFTGELGGIVALTSRLNFGANLYNFTLSSFENSTLPVILKCGLSGKASDDLIVSIEAEKNTYEPLLIKWGAQYKIAPPMKLLLGFRHPVNSLHAGIAASHRGFEFAYSFSWNFRLGLSQEFSIALTPKRK